MECVRVHMHVKVYKCAAY